MPEGKTLIPEISYTSTQQNSINWEDTSNKISLFFPVSFSLRGWWGRRRPLSRTILTDDSSDDDVANNLHNTNDAQKQQTKNSRDGNLDATPTS